MPNMEMSWGELKAISSCFAQTKGMQKENRHFSQTFFSNQGVALALNNQLLFCLFLCTLAAVLAQTLKIRVLEFFSGTYYQGVGTN